MNEYYEFVSLYHPDRLCDYLISCLLDYCIKKDEFVEFRLDCTLADNVLNFIGIIKINCDLTKDELSNFIRKELRDLNLLHKPINLNIEIINKKTKRRNFDGTGIYYGFACTHTPFYIPLNYLTSYITHQRLESIYKNDYYKSNFIFQDNKILQSITLDSQIGTVDLYNPLNNCEINYNYKAESNLMGMSGRKLGIDYYNALVPNNGGSPWGKDPYNTDLVLNIYAHKLAVSFIKQNKCFGEIKSKLIYLGKNRGILEFYSSINNLIGLPKIIDLNPNLVENLKLNRPIYKKLCKNGFIFSKI